MVLGPHDRGLLAFWQRPVTIVVVSAKKSDKPPTRFEIEGRADKAWKLARFIRARGYDFRDAAEFDEAQWELMRQLAKLSKTPSERTKGMVVGFLTPRPTRSETHG